jgi:hypothetical protein
MYIIANVIYGIPLHDKTWDVEYSPELEEMLEAEEGGFRQYYHGSADNTPSAFGVEVAEFDECCYFVDLTAEITTATQSHIDEFNSLWDALTPTLKDEISSKYGQPRTFILWTSS